MRAENALIARRHVIYVGGYDPQGAEGYYRLFERSWKRFLTLWPLATKLGPLELDSEDFAHWDIEAAGPIWQVSTRYEFSRQEHIIRANMAEPMRRQIPRALAWTLDYLVSGALVRVLRTSWAFGLVLIYFQMMLIWWLVLSVAGGGLIAYLAAQYLGLPEVVGLLIGIARALERDPDIGRRGPPLILLTLGSIAPGAALHPKAVRLRAITARLAAEPSIVWVDCQSRADIMNFWDFDPVEGIGAHAGEARCNPWIWMLRFRDMLSPQLFRRLRFDFFRLHYQFIMANDRRARYDYFMLLTGPVPVATWASQ